MSSVETDEIRPMLAILTDEMDLSWLYVFCWNWWDQTHLGCINWWDQTHLGCKSCVETDEIRPILACPKYCVWWKWVPILLVSLVLGLVKYWTLLAVFVSQEIYPSPSCLSVFVCPCVLLVFKNLNPNKKVGILSYRQYHSRKSCLTQTG